MNTLNKIYESYGKGIIKIIFYSNDSLYGVPLNNSKDLLLFAVCDDDLQEDGLCIIPIHKIRSINFYKKNSLMYLVGNIISSKDSLFKNNQFKNLSEALTYISENDISVGVNWTEGKDYFCSIGKIIAFNSRSLFIKEIDSNLNILPKIKYKYSSIDYILIFGTYIKLINELITYQDVQLYKKLYLCEFNPANENMLKNEYIKKCLFEIILSNGERILGCILDYSTQFLFLKIFNYNFKENGYAIIQIKSITKYKVWNNELTIPSLIFKYHLSKKNYEFKNILNMVNSLKKDKMISFYMKNDKRIIVGLINDINDKFIMLNLIDGNASLCPQIYKLSYDDFDMISFGTGYNKEVELFLKNKYE